MTTTTIYNNNNNNNNNVLMSVTQSRDRCRHSFLAKTDRS